jgi:preprotein translocase subunit YajC
MQKFRSFAEFSEKFLTEANDFDTNLQKDPDMFEPGDEVFYMGKWQTVGEVRADDISVADDKGKISSVKKDDIVNRGLLTKIPTPEDTVEKDPGKLDLE